MKRFALNQVRFHDPEEKEQEETAPAPEGSEAAETAASGETAEAPAEGTE